MIQKVVPLSPEKPVQELVFNAYSPQKGETKQIAFNAFSPEKVE
jgi:hypothetical protein